jgi:hypothetical protein
MNKNAGKRWRGKLRIPAKFDSPNHRDVGQTIKTLWKIFLDSGNVCVYQKEAVRIQTFLPQSCGLLQALLSAPEQVEHLRRPFESAQSLQELLRWLGPEWAQVCGDWSVRKPVKDLAQWMDAIAHCLKRFGCDTDLSDRVAGAG